MRDLEKSFEKTENDIKALQSVGQIIGGTTIARERDDEP